MTILWFKRKINFNLDTSLWGNTHSAHEMNMKIITHRVEDSPFFLSSAYKYSLVHIHVSVFEHFVYVYLCHTVSLVKTLGWVCFAFFSRSVRFNVSKRKFGAYVAFPLLKFTSHTNYLLPLIHTRLSFWIIIYI